MTTREWFPRFSSCLCISIAAGGLLVGPSKAFAQVPTTPQALQSEIEQLKSDFEAMKQQYGDRLSALEAKLTATSGAAVSVNAPPAAPSAAAQAPAAPGATDSESRPAPVFGASISNAKVFNPDIAVIGDFLGAAGTNPVHPNPFGPGTHPNALQLHEAEAALQAVVDPYARADFFFSFGEREVEEGFITLTSLPGGLLTKVGKMRAAFGKVNSLHNHVLPWADRPLVTANLVGGEDGINDAGVSVARLIPNPWMFLEATGQVFRGDSGEDLSGNPVFQTTRRSELNYVTHLRGYQDITDNANIDLGILVFARPQWGERRQSRGPRVAGHAAVWHRRDVSLEAASAVDLSLVHGTRRMDLEPSRSAERSAERHGHVRLRRLSGRAALVHRRSSRPVGAPH